jgi:hypothetical protein
MVRSANAERGEEGFGHLIWIRICCGAAGALLGNRSIFKAHNKLISVLSFCFENLKWIIIS